MEEAFINPKGKNKDLIVSLFEQAIQKIIDFYSQAENHSPLPDEVISFENHSLKKMESPSINSKKI